MTKLHQDPIVVDGLMICDWGPALFDALRAGNLSAVCCTTSVESVWEGFPDSLRTIARWREWFDNCSGIVQVRATSDIRKAKLDGQTGIILGWQNSTGFGEHLPYVSLFHELGLRVVQLTYHTANMAGSGCYESRDGGLTDFGHELVSELNRVGILIDLSHVGKTTSSDAIRASKKPVAYTHTAPSALKQHPRNKTDEQLREIADAGGIVGVTMYPSFLARGNDASVEDYVDAIEYVIRVCGEDQVAIGTDFTQGVTRERLEVFLHDKGYGRRIHDFPKRVSMPDGFGCIEDFPNLVRVLERRKLPDRILRKVLGENWLRVYEEVWGE